MTKSKKLIFKGKPNTANIKVKNKVNSSKK